MKNIDECRKMITEALPINTKWEVGNMIVIFDFSRSRCPLVSASTEYTDPDLPLDQYLVFGDQIFPGGASPLLCIDKNKLDIWRIDVELLDPISFLNSSAEQFAQSFNCLKDYIGNNETLARTYANLEAIDKDAFDKNNEWRQMLDYLKEEENEN